MVKVELKARQLGRKQEWLKEAAEFFKGNNNHALVFGINNETEANQLKSELRQKFEVSVSFEPNFITTPIRPIYDSSEIEPYIIGWTGGDKIQRGYLFKKK